MISVIISTYNRASSLKNTIASVDQQEGYEGKEVELVVVDHKSTDHTKQIVHDFCKSSWLQVKYVYENKPSISDARNRGIMESTGEILAFIDDDVIVDNRWLENIEKTFTEAGCDAMGGKILPKYPSRTPKWIKDNKDFLNGPIVYRDHGDEGRYYDKNMLPFIGAQMVYRKDCFEEHGLFKTDIGLGTDFPYGGEDVEMFFRLQDKKKIYYSADCRVWHVHAPERVTLKYVSKWFYLHGKSYAKREVEQLKQSKKLVFGVPLYIYKDTMANFGRFFINIFRPNKRLRAWCKSVWCIGRCIGLRTVKLKHLES